MSFTLGALLPLIAVLATPTTWRVPVTIAVVLVALGLAGWAGARLGGATPSRAVLRVMIGGALGLAATYGIGYLVGGAVG